MRCASSRFEAIVFGTDVDFIETLKFSKSRRSISSTVSVAAVTSASTGFSYSSSRRCLGSEPEFTPTRSGVPCCLASAITSATFSGPPMLPGFSRTQCAPASIAFSASVWLKWMSAMIGIGEDATIVFSASASCSRGTATRTMSAPASATVRICSIVAVKLAVSVLVIVCTATGAPPPTGTAPTCICRLDAMGWILRCHTYLPAHVCGAPVWVRDPAGLGVQQPSAAEVRDVVADAVDHQQHEQHDPDRAVAVHGGERDPPTARLLGERPQDVAAVEGQEWEQVEHGQDQRDEPGEHQRVAGTREHRFVGDLGDADDAVELAADFCAGKRFADVREQASGGDPHLVHGNARRSEHAHWFRGGAEVKADQHPSERLVVARADRER